MAITTFISPPNVDNAIADPTAAYDGAIFESEHNPLDIKEVRDGMQYMLAAARSSRAGRSHPRWPL